jgi:hypothetical protein
MEEMGEVLAEGQLLQLLLRITLTGHLEVVVMVVAEVAVLVLGLMMLNTLYKVDRVALVAEAEGEVSINRVRPLQKAVILLPEGEEVVADLRMVPQPQVDRI